MLPDDLCPYLHSKTLPQQRRGGHSTDDEDELSPLGSDEGYCMDTVFSSDSVCLS